MFIKYSCINLRENDFTNFIFSISLCRSHSPFAVAAVHSDVTNAYICKYVVKTILMVCVKVCTLCSGVSMIAVICSVNSDDICSLNLQMKISFERSYVDESLMLLRME